MGLSDIDKARLQRKRAYDREVAKSWHRDSADYARSQEAQREEREYAKRWSIDSPDWVWNKDD